MWIGRWEQWERLQQTLGSGFLAGMAEPRTAKIINSTAVALLAGTLAQWTWSALAPPRETAARRAPAATIATPPLSVLLHGHLFGRLATTGFAAIPISHSTLTLSGLVFGHRALAVIGQAGQHGRAYSVGAMVSPGVVLVAVGADRAILRQQGRLVSLFLYPPKVSMLPLSLGSPPRMPVSAPRGRPRLVAPVTIVLARATLANLERLSRTRWRSWFTPRSSGGLLVASVPGQDGDALGLQPGDVVESINGRPVHSLGAAIAACRAGYDTGEITVEVNRYGRMELFRYALQGR
ncbi:MAG TPA: type II secretion system protein N [Acidiferrobacter sp.]|nr:type II secretion system protein N [Acidiferrobacter sp.]